MWVLCCPSAYDADLLMREMAADRVSCRICMFAVEGEGGVGLGEGEEGGEEGEVLGGWGLEVGKVLEEGGELEGGEEIMEGAGLWGEVGGWAVKGGW